MRLVTWNCCRGAYDAKLSRLRRLEPDVAVLQECARPHDATPYTAWFGSNSRQGVGIVAKAPFRLIAEPVRAGTQSMFAARVQGPVTFTVVAVWAQPEPTYSEGLRRGLATYRDLLLSGPLRGGRGSEQQRRLGRPARSKRPPGTRKAAA